MRESGVALQKVTRALRGFPGASADSDIKGQALPRPGLRRRRPLRCPQAATDPAAPLGELLSAETGSRGHLPRV